MWRRAPGQVEMLKTVAANERRGRKWGHGEMAWVEGEKSNSAVIYLQYCF